MIEFSGSPEHLGRLWGEVNHRDIQEDVAEFLAGARDQHGLDEKSLIARSASYNDIVSRLAPHWHEEADAVAAAAGLDHEVYRAYLAGKYRGLLFREDCTSYAAVGPLTFDGRTLFHKNRDNRARPQAFYRKQTHVPGKTIFSYLAVADTSDTGVMMMANSAGLAGSADMGGNDTSPYFRGLMNPYGLRLIAEQAGTCAEALELVRMMNEKHFYAGGATATVWTFADSQGNAMTVRNTHTRVEVVQTTRQEFVLSCEREGLAEFLRARQGELTVQDLNEASRLPGVCMESNCASFTAILDPDQPDLFTCGWAALGKANVAPYVPLYIGALGTPRAYLDGTVFAYSRRGLTGETIASFESHCEAMRARAEAEARTTLSSIEEGLARRHLDMVSAYAAEEAKKRF